VLERIIGEMKSKPFTLIVLLGLWTAVGSLWAGRANFASAGDYMSLKKQVNSVEETVQSIEDNVQRSGLETQIRGIQTELFQLNQQVTDKRAKGLQIDQIYWNRISTLQNDRDEIQRKLNKLGKAKD
jgi:hypothetical protein